MRSQTYNAILLIVLLASCVSPTLVSKKSLPMVVAVNADWGFVPEKPANDGVLNFSQLVPGTGATRQIVITNDHDIPVKIVITQQGPIKKYITVNMNNVTINAGSSMTINVTATIPDQSSTTAKKEEGTYEGLLNIELHKI